MELSRIEFYNSSGIKVLDLPVTTPSPSSSYFVKDVDGLGAVPAKINTAAYATQDGMMFQGSKTGQRNIVLSLGYVLNYTNQLTVADLRRRLHNSLVPKTAITMRLYHTAPSGMYAYPALEITGYVESLTPEIFSRTPGMQVSIVCPLPYFKEVGAMRAVSGKSNTAIPIAYEGSAPTGFQAQFTLKGTTSYISIRNSRSNLEFAYFGTGGQANDIWYVSTLRGNKYFDRSRSGSRASVLSNLLGGSPAIEIGPDVVSLTFEQALGVTAFDVVVQFPTLHLGV